MLLSQCLLIIAVLCAVYVLTMAVLFERECRRGGGRRD